MKDVIIVGTGLSALSFIDELNEDKKVLVFTKDKIDEHNSMLAQGGICYSFEEGDFGRCHASDTYEAGAQMGDRKIIRQIIGKSHLLIKRFIDDGMSFDHTSDNHLSYGLEGAHNVPRILHSGGDQTGKMMTEFFLKRLENRQVNIYTGYNVVDILKNDVGTAVGVIAMDPEGNTRRYFSKNTVLATGGYSGMFMTNSGASKTMGNGHILALRAGARLRHMEMVQFHPTLLGTKKRLYGLVSEAVRGRGGSIVNGCGERIMENVHPLKDLAPRDVTSFEVYRHVKKGSQCYVDISGIEDFKGRFPSIHKSAKRYFPDVLQGLKIPVTTGAHYTMGGVIADIDGSTDISGLRVIGETASTNFHGGNRLASNSLLEAVVMGNEAAVSINEKKKGEDDYGSIAPVISAIPYIETGVFEEMKKEAMEVLGFERSEDTLISLLDKTCIILESSETGPVNAEEWHRYCELMTIYSMLLGCLHRKETRGCHNRLDFPGNNDAFKNIEILIGMEGGSLVAEYIENQGETEGLLY